MTRLRLADESEMPVSNYDLPEQFGWHEFHDFRNHVLQVLRRFGSVGPCGELDFSVTGDDAPAFGMGGAEKPDFFVVVDMWNEHDRLSIVESDPKHIRPGLIEALAEMACAFPGWRTVMKLRDCGLDVFGDKVIVGGRRFWDCKTVEDLTSRCQRPTDYGPALPFREAMYPLWLAVVSGEFRTSTAFPAPPDREWQEAARALDEMSRRRKPGSPLSSFAYDRIRCDLHPHTRLQFVLRYLEEVSSYPRTSVEEATRNIKKDAGDALSSSQDAHERVSLARSVSAAQIGIAAWAKPEQIVFWWPHVLSTAGETEAALKPLLVREIRALLDQPNSWIQLSAVFGLALLRVDDIAGVVDRAVESNPDWSENEALSKWLRKLRAGSTTYPSLRGKLGNLL